MWNDGPSSVTVAANILRPSWCGMPVGGGIRAGALPLAVSPRRSSRTSRELERCLPVERRSTPGCSPARYAAEDSRHSSWSRSSITKKRRSRLPAGEIHDSARRKAQESCVKGRQVTVIAGARWCTPPCGRPRTRGQRGFDLAVIDLRLWCVRKSRSDSWPREEDGPTSWIRARGAQRRRAGAELAATHPGEGDLHLEAPILRVTASIPSVHARARYLPDADPSWMRSRCGELLMLYEFSASGHREGVAEAGFCPLAVRRGTSSRKDQPMVESP